MREVADIIKDQGISLNLLLVETLAAQVVSVATYKGNIFRNMAEISSAVCETAGYPMLNSFSGDMKDTIQTRAAERVADLVGVRWRDQIKILS